MFLITSIVLAIFVPDAWRAPVILAGASIEFLETSISMWISRRAKAKVGPEALIGSLARVIEDCTPDGHVLVRGETWRARCDEGAVVGEQVEIVERRGLTLSVRRATEPPPSTRPSAKSGPSPSGPMLSG